MILFGFDLLSFVEHKLQDAVFQKPGLTDPMIAVIGIDDQSLSELGSFQQWSRRIMADAINILNSNEDAKPAVIALDIMYTEEGADREADDYLVQAAADGGNVVVVSYAVTGEDLSLHKTITSYLKPFPALAEHTAYGLPNGTVDSDGVIRNALIKLEWADETIYSFAGAIVKQYLGQEPDVSFLGTNSDAYIAYYGEPDDYNAGISFSDIFAEDFDPEFFADMIVLIGPYAAGLNDAYYTPMSADTQMYGVEIHANVVQMLLEGHYKQRVGSVVHWAILALLILLAMILAEYADIRVVLGVFAAFVTGYFFFAQWLFGQGYILTLIYPLVALVVIYIYQLVYGYVLSAFEKARLQSTFKKYVDPKLVDRLVESGDANSDEVGVKKHIAVLFVDVRGFTPMTEALREQPETIVKTLNEYLELTSSSVFNNGGSVDKFIGDATMALFNGFVPLDDYVFKAVKAAWDIVQGAERVNASILEKYGVDVGFGVGVNCGEAIVGNLGPSFRKDYTAIGDTVNTAARLESNAKRGQILISRDVYEQVKDRVEAVSVGELPLKGKSIKLEIFSVTGVKGF